MSHRTKAYLLLLTTAIIWGIASPIIKYTLSYISPFSFLFWRFLIVSLILLPLFFIYKAKKKIKLTLKKVMILSGLGFLATTFGLGLLFIGYNYTTAIDAVLIYAVAPIFVVIGGAIFLNENITSLEKIGSIIAFLGSVATVFQPILEGKTLAWQNIGGNILVLISALSWAGYCLIMKKMENKNQLDPFILTCFSFFVGFITIIPLFLWEQSTINYLTINHLAIPGILYMSIFSSIIAYFTYNLGFSLIEASEATVFDYLKPLFAAPLAVLWLGEQITLPFLLGAGLIALGVILTEWKSTS